VYRCEYWLALCGAAALVTVLNWVGTSDDAAQVVMAGLLAVAAGLGWAVSRPLSSVAPGAVQLPESCPAGLYPARIGGN
jgi:hypothetical protein